MSDMHTYRWVVLKLGLRMKLGNMLFLDNYILFPQSNAVK